MTPRKTPLTAVLAVLAALALPAAAADGARPINGTFKNLSHRNGVLVETTRYNIKRLSFYCNQTRWDLIQFVRIHRDGTFRFRGRLTQYGHSGQPWGRHVGRFSGRFTSRKRVRIKRKLAGRCGRATVKAKGKRD
jgi:hypothetical protein